MLSSVEKEPYLSELQKSSFSIFCVCVEKLLLKFMDCENIVLAIFTKDSKRIMYLNKTTSNATTSRTIYVILRKISIIIILYIVCFVLGVLNFVLQYEILDSKDKHERKLNILWKYEFSWHLRKRKINKINSLQIYPKLYVYLKF